MTNIASISFAYETLHSTHARLIATVATDSADFIEEVLIDRHLGHATRHGQLTRFEETLKVFRLLTNTSLPPPTNAEALRMATNAVRADLDTHRSGFEATARSLMADALPAGVPLTVASLVAEEDRLELRMMQQQAAIATATVELRAATARLDFVRGVRRNATCLEAIVAGRKKRKHG